MKFKNFSGADPSSLRRGRMAPCWYSRLLYSNLLGTSIFIETPEIIHGIPLKLLANLRFSIMRYTVWNCISHIKKKKYTIWSDVWNKPYSPEWPNSDLLPNSPSCLTIRISKANWKEKSSSISKVTWVFRNLKNSLAVQFNGTSVPSLSLLSSLLTYQTVVSNRHCPLGRHHHMFAEL